MDNEVTVDHCAAFDGPALEPPLFNEPPKLSSSLSPHGLDGDPVRDWYDDLSTEVCNCGSVTDRRCAPADGRTR